MLLYFWLFFFVNLLRFRSVSASGSASGFECGWMIESDLIATVQGFECGWMIESDLTGSYNP